MIGLSILKQDRKCTYKKNNLACSRNHCSSRKAVSIRHSECVCVCVSFVIQHAMRMRSMTMSTVTCLALPYFSTLSHKRHDFRGGVIEHKMCVLIFSTTFVWNISHPKKNSGRYHSYLLTYLLTPWSRVLLEKLPGSAASQEIPPIFGTRRFLTVLTSACHLSLSWANSIQSPLPEDPS